MSRLKVRPIQFRFDETTSYYWHHSNTQWGNLVNFITLIGPAFERYFIKAIRQALPQIKNPAVREDAELFCHQEAQHSRQHLAHFQALGKQHPGLDEVRKQVLSSYEKLFASRSLEFHLSYAATVELAFGPIAKFMVENREQLFSDCDDRIAAFILWHFVEEFEHRNSAIDVYNDVVCKYGYRMRMAIDVVKHLRDVELITRTGLARVVPPDPRGILPNDLSLSAAFRDIPFSRLCTFGWNLLCSQMPLHKPDNLHQPDWVTQWFADEAAGKDMTHYPVRSLQGAG
jgi:predicted metal-dependent hydrolase